jgi:hypothetical protein
LLHITAALSRCLHLRHAPKKRPFVSETNSEGHAYQLCHLTSGEANQRTELGRKEAIFPSKSSVQQISSAASVPRAAHWTSSAVHTDTGQADTSGQSTLLDQVKSSQLGNIASLTTKE